MTLDRSSYASCDRCGKPVCLDHDPPQPCGKALCPDCPGCECPECTYWWERRMFSEGIYSERADPLLIPGRESEFRPLSDWCTTHSSKRYACKEKHR